MNASDFNRSQTPPGGWQFYQSQTAWNAPNPIAVTFDQQVINIIKHRAANQAATIKYQLSLDPFTVGNELERFTRLRLGIPFAPTPVNFPTPPRRLPEAVEAAVVGVKKLASGAALLFEWEESGLPPEPVDEAERRAHLCAQCPKNDPSHFSKYFTQQVSEMLRKRLARLWDMNLITTQHEKINVCSACWCPLKLKVWTPMSLVVKHTGPEAKADLWEKCWIPK